MRPTRKACAGDRDRRAPDAGMTLVETMVAGLLLIVGIVAVMGMFPDTYRQTMNYGRHTEINHLSTRSVERLKALDFGHADLAIGVHPTPVNESGRYFYRVTGEPREVSLKWTVSAGPADGSGTPHPGMKTIVVEAGYNVWYDASDDLVEGDNSYVTRVSTFVAE